MMTRLERHTSHRRRKQLLSLPMVASKSSWLQLPCRNMVRNIQHQLCIMPAHLRIVCADEQPARRCHKCRPHIDDSSWINLELLLLLLSSCLPFKLPIIIIIAIS